MILGLLEGIPTMLKGEVAVVSVYSLDMICLLGSSLHGELSILCLLQIAYSYFIVQDEASSALW